MPRRQIPPLSREIGALAGLFLVSGTLHLARPRVYEGIIPTPLRRWRRPLVLVSGVAELTCAAAMLHPRTRRVGGLASAALLVAVFPANVQMSVSHGRRAARRRDTGARAMFAGTLARLPMQWPMIRTALRAAGRI